MSKFLCIGLTCIDIIQTVKKYPIEDSDQRSLDCRIQRGGNASNICTVLSILGTNCEFFGTLASGPFLEFVREDLKKHNINFDHCVFHEGCDFPISSILINSQNGSRTIVHSNKNLPELSFDDFKKLPLKDYSWIHFEGRNEDEVKKMIEHINSYNISANRPIKISLELEKPKLDYFKLVRFVDVVFVGKDFCKSRGWAHMDEGVMSVSDVAKEGALIICPWGDKGASALDDLKFFTKPAVPTDSVVDTLGAGDTFCAAAIHYLLQGKGAEESVEFACKVAGAKVGIHGYEGLRDKSKWLQ